MNYKISTDKSLIDLSFVHNYLSNTSYWSKGISIDKVQKSIQHSLCFGIYQGKQQVGFARVVTDYTRMAYLADVFILDTFQGQGLGKQLIQTIINYPELKEVAKWFLLTADAHGLYEQYGFTKPKKPEMYMERVGRRSQTVIINKVQS